jgi:TonB-linked SusC/RagA family outer membrane protein
MKLSVIFVFVAALHVTAAGYSQNLNLKMKNVILRDVFKEIEQQSELSFLFSDELSALNEEVSVECYNENYKDVLDQLFLNTNLGYQILNEKLIVVAPKSIIQQQSVTGTVTDENGEPLPGVNVIIKGTTTGVVTGVNGRYSINVPGKDVVLIFSFMGFATQEVTVEDQMEINITLSEDTREIEEVVVVGYGTQRKGNVTGSIATVKSEKLNVAPVTNVTQTLGGQLPGLISKQTRGTPGSDDASLQIRGFGSALVIVDGAESSMNHLDPSQIESVTILKDGSASIYGARAGNGVILVTTKRGIESKPIITLNSSTTLQGSTNIFPATSSWQRAQLKREQHINAGLPLSQVPYTEEEIRKYQEGTDPNYGNYNWFDATVRNWAPQQNHNISVRGGSERIKYYGYFGYNKQETILKNDGGDYTRYNLQSTVDAKITDRITASIEMSLTGRKEYFPPIDGINHANFWETLYQSDPAYPTSLPNPDRLSYANIPLGSSVYMTSTELAGYTDNRNRHIRSSGSVVYDFKYVKGLKAKALIYYNYSANIQKRFTRQRDFYLYDFEHERYTHIASSTNPTSMSQQSGIDDNLTQQYSLSYNNVFSEIHNLSAIVIYEAITSSGNGFSTQRGGFNSLAVEQFSAGESNTASNSSWSSEMGRVSWISRLNYILKGRYLLETIFRADASAKFAPKRRWGYFPSVSLGWVLSEENFMKSLPALDNMKLRASMGKSGYDAVGDFNYLSIYGFDGGYKIGNSILTGIYSTRLASDAFSWEKMTIYNAGVDFSFFKRKIYGTIEGFYRLREGILGSRNRSVPSSFGANLPTENLNSQDTRGFEFNVGNAGKTGDFSYDISGNISWSRSKHVSLDEAEYANEDQKRIYGRNGRWTDLSYGYVSDGLFSSQPEIDELSYIYADLNGNSTLRPGDIKYKNLNGDNKLDWRDQTIIGKGSMPNWMYGINGLFQYKNFDLSLLFQGAFGYTTYVWMDPLYTDYAFSHRWTEENNDPRAIVPRVGSNGANGLNSDYWTHNTSYIRLKNAALGYTVPKKILSRVNIEQIRIYLAGTNLLTLSSLGKYGVNPEQSNGDPTSFYPMQRNISVGLNLSF